MRVDVLHKRLVHDIAMMQPVVDTVFPVELPATYLNRSMNLRGFVDRLNAVTSPDPFRIHNEVESDLTLAIGQLRMSGLWLGESELPENNSSADIRVIWHVHPSTRRLTLSAAEWHRRRYYWWQIVMHEIIHRHQDVYRVMRGQDPREYAPQTTDRASKSSQAYYGNYDEIEAHSHNAALEFLCWWNLPLKECIASAYSYTGRSVTPIYNFYLAEFAETPRHPAVRTFKRKVASWYAEMRETPEVYRTLQLPRLVG